MAERRSPCKTFPKNFRKTRQMFHELAETSEVDANAPSALPGSIDIC